MGNRGQIRFVEKPLDDCVEAAERYAARGDSWHNHVLKPACIHNPHPGKYVLIVENSTKRTVVGFVSDTNPIEAEQHIVRLRHGSDVIGRMGEEPPSDDEPELLKKIRSLVVQGIDWHHHMIVPDCVLNPYPGRWLITLESDNTDEVLEYVCEDEPIETLRAIETLFFGMEAKKPSPP